MKTEINIFIDSVAKFIKKEFAPFIEKLDLYPQVGVPFNLNEKLSQHLSIKDMDGEFLRVENIVRVLLKISEICAGIAAFVAYLIAGEIFRRKFGTDIPPGIVAFSIFEDSDTGMDGGKPEFATILEGSSVKGIKKSVLLAPCAEFFSVFLKGDNGNSLAWVRKENNKVKVLPPVGLIGLRALPCADVEFEAAEAISSKKIDNKEFAYLISILSIFNSACACGTATKALADAWEYARQRYQGGRMICKHDAIRLLYFRNISAINSSIPALIDTSQRLETGNIDSIIKCLQAKVTSTSAAVNATLDAIQILGGYGYMRDYGVEKRFRDAVALSLLPMDNTRALLLCNVLKHF